MSSLRMRFGLLNHINDIVFLYSKYKEILMVVMDDALLLVALVVVEGETTHDSFFSNLCTSVTSHHMMTCFSF